MDRRLMAISRAIARRAECLAFSWGLGSPGTLSPGRSPGDRSPPGRFPCRSSTTMKDAQEARLAAKDVDIDLGHSTPPSLRRRLPTDSRRFSYPGKSGRAPSEASRTALVEFLNSADADPGRTGNRGRALLPTRRY